MRRAFAISFRATHSRLLCLGWSWGATDFELGLVWFEIFIQATVPVLP